MKVKLEEVCEFITDGTHQTPTYCNNGGYIFLSSKDVTSQEIDWENAKHITEELHEQLYSRLSPRKNDILLAKNGTTGVAAIVDRDEIFDVYVSLAVLRPKSTIFPKYLCYAVNSPPTRHQFNIGLKGIGVPNLHLSVIRKTEIKVYEYSKQIKICEMLDQISKLILLRNKQLEQLDLLIKSRFVEMFGDPVKNEKCWEKTNLSSCLNIIGGYAFNSKEFVKEKGLPVLRIGNINTGYFKPLNLVYYEEQEKLSKYKVYPGDVVITLTGTVDKDDYGNICILGNDYKEYYLNQRNAKLELFSSLNKYYLFYILKFSGIKKHLTGISRGIRQANISNKDIEKLEIPLPPLALQTQFADFVQQVDKAKASIKQSLEQLETLKKKLMQDYFG